MPENVKWYVVCVVVVRMCHTDNSKEAMKIAHKYRQ